MRRTSIALVMLSCIFPLPAEGDPVVLGQHLIGSDQGSRENIQLGLPGTFFWGFPDVGADLFGVVLTADDVGRTFRATAENDPNFALAAAMLTNGVSDRVGYSLRFADGGWGAEDDFEGSPQVFTMIPQPGDVITAISFRLDAFHLEEGVEDGLRFRQFRYHGLISIDGIRPGATPDPDPDPVPEPATMTLLGTGLAALIGARRRRAGFGVAVRAWRSRVRPH
jgi:hypothetical protein